MPLDENFLNFMPMFLVIISTDMPPPDAGAADWELDAALPTGPVLLLLFAKLENPVWPKAGAEPDVPPDVPPDAAAQGELFAPSWDDCPKPMELGFPKAGAEEGAALLKPREPDAAPAVMGAAAPEPALPHGDEFCPSWEADPKADGPALENGDALAAGAAWAAGAGAEVEVPSTTVK